MIGQYIWDETFTTGVLTTDDPRAACATGLSGWATCMAGAKPPDKFGEGMAAIGRLLGILPTPENLSTYGDRVLAELKTQDASGTRDSERTPDGQASQLKSELSSVIARRE